MPPEPQLKIRIEIDDGPLDEMEAALLRGVDDGIDKLRDEIEWKWREYAAKSLNTTTKEYLDGLSVEREGDGVTVSLTGWLPVALEQGHERFDMKPGLLQGKLWRRIFLKGKNKFRMVSINQRGQWWHPGLQARNIGNQVKAAVPDMVEDIFVSSFDRIKV